MQRVQPVLFLTAVSLGLAAGTTRKAVAIVLSPLLLIAVFGLAAMVSAGGVSFIDLLIAIAGLNVGLICVLGAMLLAAVLSHPASTSRP